MKGAGHLSPSPAAKNGGSDPASTRPAAAPLHTPTVVACALLVYGTALALHELGHVAADLMVGADPTLLSSTDVRAELAEVSARGYLAIGAAGSLVNALLAALGGLLFVRGRGRSGAAACTGWLALAVNGYVPTLYLVTSPLLGFGDWDTVLRRFAAGVPLRAVLAALGVAAALLWHRLVVRTLARWLSGLERGQRGPVASRLAHTAWLAGGGLALAAAVWSPLPAVWALGIAAGSTLGTTWPLLAAADRAPQLEVATPVAWRPVGPSRGWLAAGLLAGVLFVALLGPGIRL